jgi:hypothetical protein
MQKKLEEEISSDPESHPYYMELVDLLIEKIEEESGTSKSRLSSNRKTAAELQKIEAIKAYHEGDYEKAALLLPLEELDPDCYSMLGSCNEKIADKEKRDSKIKHYQSAIENYEKAAELGNSRYDYLCLGRAHHKLSQLQKGDDRIQSLHRAVACLDAAEDALYDEANSELAEEYRKIAQKERMRQKGPSLDEWKSELAEAIELTKETAKEYADEAVFTDYGGEKTTELKCSLLSSLASALAKFHKTDEIPNILKNIDNELFRSLALKDMAVSLAKRKKYKEAKDLAKQMENPGIITSTYISIASIEADHKKYKEAGNTLKLAEKAAEPLAQDKEYFESAKSGIEKVEYKIQNKEPKKEKSRAIDISIHPLPAALEGLVFNFEKEIKELQSGNPVEKNIADAFIEAKAGNREKADELLEKASRCASGNIYLFPGNFQLVLFAYAYNNELDKAKSLMEKTNEDNLLDSKSNLAAFLYSIGQPDKAFSIAEEIKYVPKDSSTSEMYKKIRLDKARAGAYQKLTYVMANKKKLSKKEISLAFSAALKTKYSFYESGTFEYLANKLVENKRYDEAKAAASPIRNKIVQSRACSSIISALLAKGMKQEAYDLVTTMQHPEFQLESIIRLMPRLAKDREFHLSYQALHLGLDLVNNAPKEDSVDIYNAVTRSIKLMSACYGLLKQAGKLTEKK